MPNRFSEYTSKIQSMLPYWFKEMRTNTESVGAQFMNIFGLALEDIRYIIDYAYEQCSIKDADIDQIDTVYKVLLPISITDKYSLVVTAGEGTIHLDNVDSLEEFFSTTYEEGVYSEIEYINPFIVDYTKHLLYVRHPYNQDDEYLDGKIRVTVYNGERPIYSEVLKLSIHPVWNFFDEFGLLLSLPRLPREINESYKDRLLDVFKHPANASMMGLVNGIGRELGLRKHYIWANPKEDYVIDDLMVIVNTIEVNNSVIDEAEIYVTLNNEILLKGDPESIEYQKDITWISGFSIHELHNKNDVILQPQIDEAGKPMLNYILDKLDRDAPILWGSFIWDEGYWDIGKDIPGCVPGKFDALTKKHDIVASNIIEFPVCDEYLFCDDALFVDDIDEEDINYGI